MKQILLTTGLISFTLTAGFAQAHSPEEHAQNGEDPNCAAMQTMDHSNMDMDDPVMQAMMEKCMGHMDDHSAHGTSTGQDQTDQDDTAHEMTNSSGDHQH